MRDNGIPIYYLLFYGCPQALQDLNDYQRTHYGCNLEKPPQPKQKPLEIPVSETTEELERIQKLPPQKGRGY